MIIESSAAQSIEKCGEQVEITKGQNTYNTTAVIQPLRYKYSSSFSQQYVPEGYAEEQSYIYIGKPDVGVDKLTYDTIVSTSEDSYVVKRSEKVCYSGNVVYIWALLQKHIEEV